MNKEKVKEDLNFIIDSYLKDEIDVEGVLNLLDEKIDILQMYEIEDDMLITDCYFGLAHLKEAGNEATKAEMKYFLECFSGKRIYDLDEKFKVIIKSGELDKKK